MARGPRLTRLAALAAGVLAVHGAALHWLAAYHHAQASVLKPMVDPLFTRVIVPAAPPPPVAVAPAAAPVRPAIRSIAKSTPPAGTPTHVADAVAKEAAVPPPPPQEAPSMIAEAPPAGTPEAGSPVDNPPPATDTGPGASTPEATATTATVATPSLDTWPTDTRLTYRLGGRFRSGELYGDARVQWQREGPRYQVRVDVDVSPWATMVMTSQGEVTPQGLAPMAFEEARRSRTRGLRLTEREVLLAGGRAVPRPPGVQDTASQFVELSHRFATGREALEVGRTVSFWMARPGAVDFWTYDIVARETLRTPTLGDVEAFHLKPRPIANPRGNITAEMWFAPSLQYLPVRIRVNMGEEAHVDLLVETIEQR